MTKSEGDDMAETVLTIDARGDACPIPVVRTLKALGALAGPGAVETLVDNEVAVQNLTRMGEGRGCEVVVEQLGQKEWRVTVRASEAVVVGSGEAESVTCDVPTGAGGAAAAAPRNVVVAITAETMGTGDDELGRKLMKGFVFALTQLDELPSCVLLYNGGAHLSCEGSDALDDLRGLAESGVEVLTCGTCLDHYGLTDRLAVGEVTNMYVIAQRLCGASHVVRP